VQFAVLFLFTITIEETTAEVAAGTVYTLETVFAFGAT
jgi:hypothetical protein